MKRSEGYRRQSHKTRVAARAHLRQLREDRLARRGQGQHSREPQPEIAEGPSKATQAPQLSVSRATSEAISQWSRRDDGAKGPAPVASDDRAAPPDPRAGSRADAAPRPGDERGGHDEAPAADPAAAAQECDSGPSGGAPAAPHAPGVSVITGDSAAIPPDEEAPPAPPELASEPASTVSEPAASAAVTPAREEASDAALPTGAAPDEPPGADGEAVGEANPTASEPIAGDGPDAPAAMGESDLHSLPGAGIGLVWMLHRCGVRNLADLAAADAERLRREIGRVGDLLDLSGWIAFARDAVEDAPPAHP